MKLDDVTTFLNQPLVASALTFAGTLLGADLKRRFDLRALRREEEERLARQELKLKTLQVVARIELLSEQRKQMGFAPTPTEVKLAAAKTDLADCGHSEDVIKETIEAVLPMARKQAQEVIARSILPLTHGSSGEHAIVIPNNPLPRDGGDR